MPVILILGGVAILYLLLENRNTAISSGIVDNSGLGTSVGQSSAPILSHLGSFQLSAYAPGPSVATQAIGYGQQGLSAGAGIAGGLATGSIVPVIGTLAGLAVGVISAIEKHHQQAVAAEGRALNENDPIAIGDFALTVEAAKAGQINYQQAKSYTDMIVADWYLSVKKIQKGTWHYQGSDLNVTHANSYASRSGPYGSSSKNPDSHAPDPCNGPCVVGHYFIERGALITLAAVQHIQAGQHGSVTYPTIPPHDAQTGLPAKTVNF